MNGFSKNTENVIGKITELFAVLLNEPSVENSLKLLADRIGYLFPEQELVAAKIEYLGKEYKYSNRTDHDMILISDILINGKTEGSIELSLKGLHPDTKIDKGKIEEYKKRLEQISKIVTLAFEKRAEIMELKVLERKTRTCYDKLDDFIFVVDRNGNIVHFNNAFENCTGYSPNELYRMNISDLVSSDAVDKGLLSMMEEALEKGSSVFSFEYQCKTGEIFPIKLTCKPMDNGEEKLFICVGKDLSETKNVEQDLLKRERDKLHNYLDVAGSIIGIVNTDLKVIFVNKKGADVLGYDKDEIIGENWFDKFLPESVREVTKSNFVKVLNHELDPPEYFENFVVTKGGEERLIFWHDVPVEDETGKRIGVISSGEDITESRKMEAMLVESENNLKTILNNIDDLIYICRPYGNFIDVNEAMVSSTGYTREQMLEMSPYDIVESKMKLLMDSYTERIIKEKNVIFETIFVLGDGSQLPLELNSRLIEYKGEQAILSVARNITERKKAEKRLKRYASELKQSNELKDLFTDIIRHDLLTPASVIKGYTEEMLDTISDEQSLQLVQKVKDNNDRLIEMLDTATTLAKLQKEEDINFEIIDVVPVFKMVIESFSGQIEGNNQTVNMHGCTSCPAVVNPIVEEVFANLLSNAIKYSSLNSTIDIDFSEHGNIWKIAVSDRGVGVPNSDKMMLFNRFERADKKGIKGTGLGLAIVKRIIELHEGEYGVEDNPEGKGSIFWVTLKKAP